jgi:hypothetical protein
MHSRTARSLTIILREFFSPWVKSLQRPGSEPAKCWDFHSFIHAAIQLAHQLTHHDVYVSQVMGKRDGRGPLNPCDNPHMACIRRISKNRIPSLNLESRTQSRDCDVMNKSDNDNSMHRHMLAFRIPLPI